MKRRTVTLAAVLILAGVITGILVIRSRAPGIRNIVLISIDTCRADYLGCYGFPRKITPNMDRFAETATRFEHAIAPVPITLPSHCTMLTGTIPPSHGVHDNIGYQLAPANRTLAEMLKENGFNTAAIVSAMVLDKSRGMAQGFDTYNDKFDGARPAVFGSERRGDETSDLAIEWLEENRERPFFLFLHYFDPHKEYVPPEPYATVFAGNPYAGEVSFTDHCIGQVLKKIKQLDLDDSTLVIITADHGEMLGEHGELTHGAFVYESAIKVPLIIRMPGQSKGMVVSEPVGLVDIAPTICSLLDMDTPGGIQGRDISSFLKGSNPDEYQRNIYSESILLVPFGATPLMAISTGKWKYIQAPRPELYDIENDPGEERNMNNEEHHRARILKDKLKEILETSVRRDEGNRMKPDAESIRKLESLGYVAGASEDEFDFEQGGADPKDVIHLKLQLQDGVNLSKQGKHDEGRQLLEELIPKCPDVYILYRVLGDIAMHQEEWDRAIRYYRRAVELDVTDDVLLLNVLAWVQAARPSLESRDPDEAVRLAEKACELTHHDDPVFLDTLAVAYAAIGDFPNAVKTAKRAHALALPAGNAALVQELAAHLKLFEQSKPYIEE